jgi:putative addiction module killer protein
MIEIRKTEAYANWLDGLRDVHARARVLVRVERLAAGNPGNVNDVGEGVSELQSITDQVIGCIMSSTGRRP